MKKDRMPKLKELMKSNEIDFMVLTPGTNLYYFTALKMHLSERPTFLFVSPQWKGAILVPVLAIPTATAALAQEYNYYSYTDEEGHDEALKRVAKELELDAKRIGVPSEMRFAELEMLRKYAPHASFVDGGPFVDDLRMCKDEEELACLRQAADITEKGLHTTLKMIRPGVTEQEVLSDLKNQMLSLGSGELFKALCVGSGPRSGNPIALASDRKVELGDLLLIDTGATYGGYAYDMTRTFAIGRIDDEMKRIYEVVKKAQAAVTSFSKTTFTAEELDDVARNIIVKEGYGKYMLHRNGHGIGLDQHEAPYIVKGNKMEMKVGMVFSNEPGLYVRGKGGVRIEDIVVVTKKGLEPLSNFPRELIIL